MLFLVRRFNALVTRYFSQFRFAQSYYDATVQAAAEAAVILAESMQVCATAAGGAIHAGKRNCSWW